jgi:hypothetical protein
MSALRLTAAGVPLLLLALATASAPAAARAGGGPKDYVKVDPKDLGVEAVEPKKDPKTGFVVGGKNATALVKGLETINGIAVADLEKAMRPGGLSKAGFLGKDERLLDVMADDNDHVLGKLKLTHQEMARHLHVLGAIGRKEQGKEVAYRGVRFRVEVTAYRGYQHSPFRDGTKTNEDAKVTNLDNGKTLTYSLLVPLMIERYGFYEGKGTSYRVDPARVVEVLTFLAPKEKK